MARATTATIIGYASNREAKKGFIFQALRDMGFWSQEKERDDMERVEERMNDWGRDVKERTNLQVSPEHDDD